jgi:hypothetical protein
LFPTNTVPPLTLAPPVNVFTPLNVKAPLPLFTKLPAPLNTPANTPESSVSAVPFTTTDPVDAPSKLKIVTAAGDKFTVPSATTAADAGIVAPEATVNVAPTPTVNPVEASEPALKTNEPPLTTVAPV